MRVWVEDWEWQCCGGEFAVGDEVEWGLLPEVDRSYLAGPLGRDMAGTISHFETHHAGEGDEEPVPTRARIESILAAYWQVAARPEGDRRVLYPVDGTAVLEPRQSADGWEADRGDGLEFEGYIVTLTPLD